MSRDNTLLSKLGFADPDKQSPVHDAACRYLAQREVANRLLETSINKGVPGYFCSGEIYGLKESGPFVLDRVGVEEPISKGSGQYKTTIGFMDVVLFSVQQTADIEVRRRHPAFGIGVEVKHTQKSIHDVIRQIKLYREYTDNPYGQFRYGRDIYPTQWGVKIIDWYLATTFDINQQELELLKLSGIQFIRLGKGFDEYMQQSKISSVAFGIDLDGEDE